MAPRKKPSRSSAQVQRLRVHNPHAAGIDVHSDVHFVSVSPEDVPEGCVNPDPGLPAGVRKFAAYTGDLEVMAAWLKDCLVTTVAMEATGVYWITLYELLESQGFEVFLVEPRQTKHAPGRPKSDVLDCQWIRRLHSYGLLTASFRPSEEVVRWRGYQRQRAMLIRYSAQHVQHMQKALEEMNVKLTEVVSEITGETGMKIIKAILKGIRDPKKLAKNRNDRCKRSEAEIAAALYGNWRDEHLFCLKQALTLYEFYRAQIQECDVQIEACLRSFADQSKGAPVPPPKRDGRRQKRRRGTIKRDLLFRMSGVDVTAIEGIDEETALVILSECGTDMSRFATAKHFTSWLGLCPQHRQSNQRILSRRVRKGANRAASAFRLAARGCYQAKNAMGAFYRRIRIRCGAPKAVTATARKIAERFYRMLKHGMEYVRYSEEAYDLAYQQRLVKSLAHKAESFGYKLVPADTASG